VSALRDRGTTTLREAAAAGRAVGAFSTYTLEVTQAIVLAAQDTGRPVILQAGASAFSHAGLAELAAQAVLAADLASVPVGVHLDHSRDLTQIRAALEAGYTSVMVDGSHLPFEQNVALTAAAVEAARPFGAWVEAELGALAGDEDRSLHVAAGDLTDSDLTDPDLARELVQRTGVDALAVAIGNVHGTATEPRPLDLDLLKRLHENVSVPLVLHGASGLPLHELQAARRLGVAKVNVNTELRAAFLAAVEQALPGARASVDLAAVLAAGREAVRAVVVRTVHDLSDDVPGPPPSP
jgi:tagatose 1,6-diphosphate aldolase GatY/KbaY